MANCVNQENFEIPDEMLEPWNDWETALNNIVSILYVTEIF